MSREPLRHAKRSEGLVAIGILQWSLAEHLRVDASRCGKGIVGRRIEVICGCMSSGKTAALIARLSLAEADGARVIAIKHAVDLRDSPSEIVSRTGARREARLVSDAYEVAHAAATFDVVGIDEVHFFGEGLTAVVERLAATGRGLIVSGLDTDAWKRPFPPVPEIARIASAVTVLNAACSMCGAPASFTQRVAPLSADDRIKGRTRLVGGDELYEPRCPEHFVSLRGD